MSELQIERARRLRKDMTDAERQLWQKLRGRQTGGRFRRQAPIGPYIVDFVAFDHRLVVELDGGSMPSRSRRTMTSGGLLSSKSRGFGSCGSGITRFWEIRRGCWSRF